MQGLPLDRAVSGMSRMEDVSEWRPLGQTRDLLESGDPTEGTETKPKKTGNTPVTGLEQEQTHTE